MLNISLEIIDWLKKHIQIENERDVIPDIHERDIFWCKIGYNIDFEQFKFIMFNPRFYAGGGLGLCPFVYKV